MSMGSGVDFWGIKGGLSREQVFLWMDNYCRTEPLNNVVQGAVKLMHERTDGAYSRAVNR